MFLSKQSVHCVDEGFLAGSGMSEPILAMHVVVLCLGPMQGQGCAAG